jgi:hypothetical protein
VCVCVCVRVCMCGDDGGIRRMSSTRDSGLN